MRVKYGDIWVAGDHRIYCGDCLEIDWREELDMLHIEIDLVYADPPYGANIIRGGRVGSGGALSVRAKTNKYPNVKGDETTQTATSAWKLFNREMPKTVHVWWGANYYADTLPPSPCWIVWDKQRTGAYADFEIAWTNQQKPAKIFRHMWNGMIKASESREKRRHPNQKPIALAKWTFDQFDTNKGMVPMTVFDPFGGVGASAVACERTGRRAIICEYVPEYVAVILERLKAEGLEPRLEGEGETCND